MVNGKEPPNIGVFPFAICHLPFAICHLPFAMQDAFFSILLEG
jgi:hypothetical protein